MGYNKQERKKNIGGYNKGTGDESSSTKGVAIIAVIFLVGFLVYSYSQNIADIFNESVGLLKDTEYDLNTNVADDIDIDDPDYDVVSIQDLEYAIPLLEETPVIVEASEKARYQIFISNKLSGIEDTKYDLVVLNAVYRGIKPLKNGQNYAIAKKEEGKWGVINIQNNEIIVPFEYAEIREEETGKEICLVLVKKGESGFEYGLAKMPQSKILIPTEYSYLEVINGSAFSVRKKKSNYGIINEDNEIIVPLIYSKIDNLDNHYVIVHVGRKKGALKTCDGEITVPIVYDEIKVVTTDFLLVKKEGMYACINKDNEIVVPFRKAKGASIQGNVVYFVGENNKTDGYDSTGKKVF